MQIPYVALDRVERKLLNNSWENTNTQGEPSKEDNNNPVVTPQGGTATMINTVRAT